MRANEEALRPAAEVAAISGGSGRRWKRRFNAAVAPPALCPAARPCRRAPDLFARLTEHPERVADPLTAIDWVSLYALAVSEENAAGGRVVTAPTNGAAGVIPAVLHYYRRFVPGANDDGVERMLLTAGAIGLLCKEGASLSGAEVGCQGEVGSACSMAAAALARCSAAPAQAAVAAEIAMEHNLGLTCDPVAGLSRCRASSGTRWRRSRRSTPPGSRCGDGHAFVSLTT